MFKHENAPQRAAKGHTESKERQNTVLDQSAMKTHRDA